MGSKLRKILSSFLIASMFLNLSSMSVDARTRSTIIRKLKNITRDLSNVQNQISNSKSNKRKQEALRKQLNENIQQICKQVEELNAMEESLRKEIDTFQNQINQYDNEINQKNQVIEAHNNKIKEIQAEIDSTKHLVGEALKVSYKYFKKNSFLETLLSAEKFDDIIRLAKYMQKYSEYDQKLIETYTKNINEMKKIKEQTESERKNIENIQTSIKQTVTSLKTKEDHITNVRNDRKNYLNTLKKTTQNIALENEKLESRIKDLTEKSNELNQQYKSLSQQKKELEENQAAAAAHTSSVQNIISDFEKGQKKSTQPKDADNIHKSKGFCWPILGGSRVSSPFGQRRNGYFHKGMDICAKMGTPVAAANDGIVSFCGATHYGGGFGGYGNCILINHGNGIETLYGHLSGFAKGIRAGVRVKKGQVIGYVGNTTRPNNIGSGTPHLHFEVRVHGRKVNPKNYL